MGDTSQQMEHLSHGSYIVVERNVYQDVTKFVDKYPECAII